MPPPPGPGIFAPAARDIRQDQPALAKAQPGRQWHSMGDNDDELEEQFQNKMNRIAANAGKPQRSSHPVYKSGPSRESDWSRYVPISLNERPGKGKAMLERPRWGTSPGPVRQRRQNSGKAIQNFPRSLAMPPRPASKGTVRSNTTVDLPRFNIEDHCENKFVKLQGLPIETTRGGELHHCSVAAITNLFSLIYPEGEGKIVGLQKYWNGWLENADLHAIGAGSLLLGTITDPNQVHPLSKKCNKDIYCDRKNPRVIVDNMSSTLGSYGAQQNAFFENVSRLTGHQQAMAGFYMVRAVLHHEADCRLFAPGDSRGDLLWRRGLVLEAAPNNRAAALPQLRHFEGMYMGREVNVREDGRTGGVKHQVNNREFKYAYNCNMVWESKDGKLQVHIGDNNFNNGEYYEVSRNITTKCGAAPGHKPPCHTLCDFQSWTR